MLFHGLIATSGCVLGMRRRVSLERLCFYIEHSFSCPNAFHMDIRTKGYIYIYIKKVRTAILLYNDETHGT